MNGVTDGDPVGIYCVTLEFRGANESRQTGKWVRSYNVLARSPERAEAVARARLAATLGAGEARLCGVYAPWKAQGNMRVVVDADLAGLLAEAPRAVTDDGTETKVETRDGDND